MVTLILVSGIFGCLVLTAMIGALVGLMAAPRKEEASALALCRVYVEQRERR